MIFFLIFSVLCSFADLRRTPEIRQTRLMMIIKITTPTRCRNDEKISAGTSADPGVHQTVHGARHGSTPGRGHGRADTRVRDPPRPAVLSRTGRVPPGTLRQRRQL